ncbi:MAG: NAD+ synthase [Theionarchaea archaeon]|nr:NAD+ synthase [Theionarchaea archaeon]MBU7037981.1 NAD+ synthase [Theionarchaea archaeon]
MNINAELLKEHLIDFISGEVAKSPFDKVVIGISGGIDSAVVAYLAAEALGKRNVIGILMPYRTMSEENKEDASAVIDDLGIPYVEVDISPMVDAFKVLVDDTDKRRLGSKMVRERMSILYYYADRYKAAVLGTSNKSEDLLGYFTNHGDSAWDINPISGLFKTQVIMLGLELGVPERIVEKKSTADFWVGQTDEEEFGFTYFEADTILHQIEKGYSAEDLVDIGLDEQVVRKVLERVDKTAHKRVPPSIPQLPREVLR